MTAQQPSAVARHYRQGGLLRKIDEALDRLYPGHTTLTTDDLHGVDEFHIGGHAATRELAEHLELRAGLRVLDAGSGLGGPARHLAQHAGADVTGVDLTEEYVDVARRLTDRVGLADRARFQQGDVTALPFPRASFDRAWMLHVGMNIEDKGRLFTEISRVLTDNGLFIVYDVMLLGDPPSSATHCRGPRSPNSASWPAPTNTARCCARPGSTSSPSTITALEPSSRFVTRAMRTAGSARRTTPRAGTRLLPRSTWRWVPTHRPRSQSCSRTSRRVSLLRPS
ncbi:SAM-dependent methyltransferase [Streptomyces mirabilis]|uniref:SAM-dependent methyltransferase n=1 Tax=Streptomyces mirabilis TaxID=68239 RepID=UPI00362EB434